MTDTPTLKQLTTLPGVGIKTAKVVAQTLRGAPYIAVDTHVHRVANRLGLVDTHTPLQTDAILENVIEDQHIPSAHHTMILFGRYICTARSPYCGSCPLYDTCSRNDKTMYKSNTIDSRSSSI
jgi:endonuclease-3